MTPMANPPDERPENPVKRQTFRRERSSASVSFGQPVYGNARIIANATLCANGFDDLIELLTEARHAYLNENPGAHITGGSK